MPDHQRNEQSVKRRFGVDQESCSLASVEASTAGQNRKLVDERLAKAEESLDGVTQRCPEPCRLCAVFTRLQFGGREQDGSLITICVEVPQERTYELNAALAEPIPIAV